MLLEGLTLLALLTAILHIRAEYRGPRWQVYLLKPATTTSLIGIAALGAWLSPASFRALIVAGMIFCLGGDIFLMLAERHFLKGLVSFLIGHLFYFAAFTTAGPGQLAPYALVPLLVLAVVVLGALHPHLGRLRGPVWIYVVIIMLMAWRAWSWWDGTRAGAALLAALGATAFVISDAVLALDRFRQPFPQARAIVLSTYYVAQWFIAFSNHLPV